MRHAWAFAMHQGLVGGTCRSGLGGEPECLVHHPRQAPHGRGWGSHWISPRRNSAKRAWDALETPIVRQRRSPQVFWSIFWPARIFFGVATCIWSLAAGWLGLPSHVVSSAGSGWGYRLVIMATSEFQPFGPAYGPRQDEGEKKSIKIKMPAIIKRAPGNLVRLSHEAIRLLARVTTERPCMCSLVLGNPPIILQRGVFCCCAWNREARTVSWASSTPAHVYT